MLGIQVNVVESPSQEINNLTLCFVNFIYFDFRDAALIGNFFHDPFLFQNWNLGQMSFVDDGIKQRVKYSKTLKNM